MFDNFSEQNRKRFVNEHTNLVSDELLKYINLKRNLIPHYIRFLLSKAYLITSIISLLIGLIILIVWTRIYDMATNNADDTNIAYISDVLLITSITVIVIGILALILVWVFRRRATNLLNKSIDQAQFFELLFKNLEDFNFLTSVDKVLLNLVLYRQRGFPQIEDNAKLYKYSPLFTFEYLDHKVVLQTQVWTWELKVSNNNRNIFADIGMIEYSLSDQERESLKDFSFSLVSPISKSDDLKLVEFENEEFNQKIKLQATNEELARKIFNTSVQAVLLENFNAINLMMFHIQKIENNILIKFLPSSSRVLRPSFTYSDNPKKEIDFWTISTLEEIYQMFALISLITTPNYLFNAEDQTASTMLHEEQ